MSLRAAAYVGEGRYRYERPTASLTGQASVSGRTDLQSAGFGLRVEADLGSAGDALSAALDAGFDWATSRTGALTETAGPLRAGLAAASIQSGRLSVGVTLRRRLADGLALRFRPELALPFARGAATVASVDGLGTLGFGGADPAAEQGVTLGLDMDRPQGGGGIAVSMRAGRSQPTFSLSFQQVF